MNDLIRATSKNERFIFPLLLVALSVAVVSCYGQFIDNFFTYDDFGAIEHVQSGPKAVLLGYNYILRIVANSVWMPLYHFSDLDPRGYNLFSISLHLCNALLVYLMAVRLFGDRKLAAVASLFFVTTAVGSDAIFWRAANSTPLNLFFYLLTLTAYIEYRKTGKQCYYYSSLLLFLLAVLSKEESASLPMVAALIELLFFEGFRNVKAVLLRVIPFAAIVAANVVVNYIILYKLLQVSSELVKHSSFRPLHSLLSGWAVFFLQPDGRLAFNDPRIYATAILISLSLVWVKERRLLLFGLGWVFLSFLPQSLSSLSQFEPKYIFNSVSRHLYLPSVGAAFCYAVILRDSWQRFGKAIGYALSAVVLCGFVWIHHGMITERGTAWGEEGRPVKVFLTELKKMVVQFPPNTDFFAINGPTGRAYMQQSLRAFYHNPTMTWIVDPTIYIQKPGRTAILFDVKWSGPQSIYAIDIVPLSLAELYQRMR